MSVLLRVFSHLQSVALTLNSPVDALGTRFCALKIFFFLLLLSMSSSAGTFSVSATTSILSPTGELNSVWVNLSLSLLLDKLVVRVYC